jgi:hypothetical protein
VATPGGSRKAKASGAERLFTNPACADDDLAVAGVEFPYAGTVLVASAFAVATGILGWAVLDRWQRARLATFILGTVLIALSVKVLLLNFIAAIEVPDAGISDHLYRQPGALDRASPGTGMAGYLRTRMAQRGPVA